MCEFQYPRWRTILPLPPPMNYPAISRCPFHTLASLTSVSSYSHSMCTRQPSSTQGMHPTNIFTHMHHGIIIHRIFSRMRTFCYRTLPYLMISDHLSRPQPNRSSWIHELLPKLSNLQWRKWNGQHLDGLGQTSFALCDLWRWSQWEALWSAEVRKNLWPFHRLPLLLIFPSVQRLVWNEETIAHYFELLEARGTVDEFFMSADDERSRVVKDEKHLYKS